MSLAQIRRALELNAKHGEHMMLGGGEITLHPDFEKILAMVVSICPPKNDNPTIGIITNGSMPDKALFINDMGEKGLINASLSYDQFHDPIDPKVFKAFKERQDRSWRIILNGNIHNGGVSTSLINSGRAKKLKDKYDLRDDCCCSAISLYPSGIGRMCGCANSTVITRNFMDDFQTEYRVDGFKYECYKPYNRDLKESNARKEKQALELIHG